MASEACCKRAQADSNYEPKGRYEDIAGFKTYITGSETASKGIVDVYDIFGHKPQTLQGADLLAAHTGAVVVVPDFFKGEVLGTDILPIDSDEKKARMGAFFQGPANIGNNVKNLIAVRKALADKFPAAEGHWGVFGLCWGGKIAVLATADGNEGHGRRFNVSGTAHPGVLAKEDAEVLTAPHLLLASPEEPADIVAHYKDVLAKSEKARGSEVETYPTMFHGWMGARSKLDDAENLKEFQRGYEQVATFFSRFL